MDMVYSDFQRGLHGDHLEAYTRIMDLLHGYYGMDHGEN